MAAFALGRFDYEGAQLRLLRHEHNTTFRVDSAGQRFVRRISRPGVHDRVTIAAEMAWLQAFERTPTSARPGVSVAVGEFVSFRSGARRAGVTGSAGGPTR